MYQILIIPLKKKRPNIKTIAFLTFAIITSFFKIFIAQYFPLAFSRTRITLPNVPLPSSFKQSKSFIVCQKQRTRINKTYAIQFQHVHKCVHIKPNAVIDVRTVYKNRYTSMIKFIVVNCILKPLRHIIRQYYYSSLKSSTAQYPTHTYTCFHKAHTEQSLSLHQHFKNSPHLRKLLNSCVTRNTRMWLISRFCVTPTTALMAFLKHT